MSVISPMDQLNRQTMKLSADVYAGYDEIGLQERLALESVAELVKNKRILDIGVGGGRTTPALLKLSTDYIGVDYVQEMVDRCRDRFPGVRFEHADARAMPQFSDHSFDFIVFAWSGICMVDHAGRLAILAEVRRLLAPGGVFLFSTYNRNSVEHDQLFVFPGFLFTLNPIKLALRSARFLVDTARCARNRLRFKKMESATAEYSIINDKCHNYQTMLYYITLDEQLKQLERSGFLSAPIIFARDGICVERDSGNLGDALLFVVRG
jgi:SAM-dependent methyltransferase